MNQVKIDNDKKLNAAKTIKQKGSLWRLIIKEVLEEEKPWAPEQELMPDYVEFYALQGVVKDKGLYFAKDELPPSEVISLTTADLDVEIKLNDIIEQGCKTYRIKNVDFVKPGSVEILKKMVITR